MRARHLLPMVLLTASLRPAPARATVMLHRSADELAAMADAVVVGTAQRDDRGAVAGSARWVSGRIVTDVAVTVHVPIAGPWAAGTSVTLRLPGGVVGDVGQTVSGAPVFRPGESYVLFLQRLPDGAWTVLDMSAGMFPLRADPVRGLLVHRSRAEGITFVEPSQGAVVEVAAEGEPLTPFVTRLRRAVR
ncbi:MAG: hypothetical protein U0325_02430 [Polyangiales bacterium]